MKRYLKITLAAFIISSVVLSGGWSFAANYPVPARHFVKPRHHSRLSKNEVVKLLGQAYIYGLPVVFTDFTRQVAHAANNTFSHGHQFPDHTSRWVVAPNNDTNYSSAFLDLGDDAVVLSIPDTKDRYFVVPLMDAWTNVFASFGKRTTGTKAQKYLISGPRWEGSVPQGLTQVKAPTDLVWVIGRIQVNSPDDQINFVSKIQDQFSLTTLSNWVKGNEVSSPVKFTQYPNTPSQVKDVQNKKATVVQAIKNIPIESYFNYLNDLLVKNPPLAGDEAFIKQLEKVGIKAGNKFSLTDFDSGTQEIIRKIPEEVFHRFDAAGLSLENVKPLSGSKIGDYKTDYLTRALVAYKGLGALTPEEATYIGYYTDADKNALDGNYNYTIHFEKGKLPPSTAFWSLTLYDKDRYLTANAIRRYAIGDRNNLKFNPDGSLDIYVQHENPGKEKENNWLPAPTESFNVVLRIYVPSPSYLKDHNVWVNPPLVKANNP
ncbi:DUF1254 domain-containing protein [Mucilaginibacter paludis]|uniref:DUF1254 domain-containing protein n=1 Tax=Mucilaginibacter paludis DSM 18603 TaxID=714943 RepID=H1Y5A8_9SPHI|nr:DUF1254 domain-containing protein [Mucilaginibacter paludis]EHQ28919.1 protein of unknown function DUF1254 [Mucilaginibacter paludis DSM 18603]